MTPSVLSEANDVKRSGPSGHVQNPLNLSVHCKAAHIRYITPMTASIMNLQAGTNVPRVSKTRTLTLPSYTDTPSTPNTPHTPYTPKTPNTPNTPIPLNSQNVSAYPNIVSCEDIARSRV
eukprot:CAMPEP_0202734008 /NCGR_PEP_ID=MMETSP1385-20130828/188462_1 /ASSEMBLY_ACC=CAM_ASM_000861 /TAXON_ID=933848 /ORGANISM="Elphidium margaritaceum" /LENGTH=119 /DNA_ID=CAMNT_0049400353 /DNA_START=498 /DNA_END=857 /DNA_ORIENTATION=+